MPCHAQVEIYSASLKDALDNLEFVEVVYKIFKYLQSAWDNIYIYDQILGKEVDLKANLNQSYKLNPSGHTTDSCSGEASTWQQSSPAQGTNPSTWKYLLFSSSGSLLIWSHHKQVSEKFVFFYLQSRLSSSSLLTPLHTQPSRVPRTSSKT